MNEPTATPEDVERHLDEARQKLQAFEDSVSRAQLLLRLKTASPAHPVLLFRAFFLVCTALLVAAALIVIAVPLISGDLARTLAKFDAVVPVPPGIPGLPTLLAALGLSMGIAWLATSFAAFAIGRDSQMLPWEQKRHQKLVNEVTRLTTQKAVMERIRGTPAGARPRIATPVPVSLRTRGALTPTPGGNRGGLGPIRPSGFGPSSNSGQGAMASRGAFGRNTAPGGGIGGGGFGPPPADNGSHGSGGFSGGPSFGTSPSKRDSSAFGSRDAAGFGDGSTRSSFGEPNPTSTPAGNFGREAGNGGLLGRARSGQSGMKLTPAGAAGRLPVTDAPSNHSAQPGPSAPSPFGRSAFGDEHGGLGSARSGGRSSPFGKNDAVAPSPRSPDASGLGAAPRAGAGLGSRLSAPVGFPGTPETVSERDPAGTPANMFGTPPPVTRLQADSKLSYSQPKTSGNSILDRARSSHQAEPEIVPDIVDTAPAYSGAASHSNRDQLPSWGVIDDPWLEEAIQRAEDMARNFPTQARLEFSQEAHLPFTLVISRSTPAMAVRSMVAYVEFLASISTPPRARIELQNVAALDRSFHRNVESALEPYFGGKFAVEAEPGRVEIQFKSPDPAWQSYPMLPIQE